MQFRRSLPGRGSTDFYFTEEDAGGMYKEQQEYLAALVMSYRQRFPSLAVNAVWDFGMEEGDPVRGDKYGDFSECRDYAVYNAKMLTISVNHVKLRKMMCDISDTDLADVEATRVKYSGLALTAERLRADYLASGVPWPQIDGKIREELGITALAENALPVTDPYFADVQLIRMLENTESLERILIHEIGHMLSEESGAVRNKRVKKLFTKCRDGFENLYEFCAECFMAAELMPGIALADEFRAILADIVK